MLAIDQSFLRKIAPHLERVVIFDPSANSARLMVEVIRGLGGRHVATIHQTTNALDCIENHKPQLILTEYKGPEFDGLEMIASLRRSDLADRMAPVILYTAEATVESIRGARDAGAHEFLRKPYTLKDLTKRIENVMLKPRDWIEAKAYVGPDRRRFNSEAYSGTRRRRSEKAA